MTTTTHTTTLMPLSQPAAAGDALRAACRDLGLGDDVADALRTKLLAAAPPAAPAPATGATASDAHDGMARREAEMMQLMKTSSPDKLVHDLRNLLNEVALLKAAADL